MCKAVPEKRGVVFRTKRPQVCSVCSASRCRIGEYRDSVLPLCGDPDSGAAEFCRRRTFLCLCIRILFPGSIGAMLPVS